MLNTSSSWHVGRATARCVSCGTELTPNMECRAALCDGGAVAIRAQVEKEKAKEPAKGKKEEMHAPSPFVRVDFCEKCWAEGKRPEGVPIEQVIEGAAPGSGKLESFSYWKTTVPVPTQKKKLLVDDSVLMDVFQRMEGRNEPQEVRFRFVLALILMRKRLLKYEGMEPVKAPAEGLPEGTKAPETWKMVPRGENAVPVMVVNPHLTAEQITEVSQQLSAILAEEV